MEWQPDNTVRITPPPVRKPGKPHPWPLLEILQGWGSPHSNPQENIPAAPGAHAPDPAEPPQTEETCSF